MSPFPKLVGLSLRFLVSAIIGTYFLLVTPLDNSQLGRVKFWASAIALFAAYATAIIIAAQAALIWKSGRLLEYLRGKLP
jgi:membrane-anchored protein YejM (alkaline phosphatase superfamily)